MSDELPPLAVYLLWAAGLGLVAAALLFIVVVRRLRRIRIPEGAGFQETLLHTPFAAVALIDLLDLSLDILGAPLVWFLLDRLGLKALREVSTVQALVPFTQPIPTLTLCWIAARWMERRRGAVRR